jgi:signal transduction histidine kinase
MADRGQIEQVIVNLVVKARDAMPTGGMLTIECAEVEIASIEDMPPGPAVVISERAFEPFFTTKEPDKGTGLGLSTVYGIVKQSGGAIRLESEPGHGCTFEIFFPAIRDAAHASGADQSPSRKTTRSCAR